jgi:hypothetical protein
VGAPKNFDTTRIRFGEMIAAVAGLVLIISPFLEWYNVSAKNSAIDFSIGGSGWDVLSWVPWLITLIGLVAIGLAVAKAAGALPNLPASSGFIILVLGGAAVVFTLFRLLVVPDGGAGDIVDVGRSFGIFIAFLAALGVALGGWLSWNEEGKPKPGGAGSGAGAAGPGAGGGGALGGGQQYGGAPSGQPYAGGAPAGGQPQAAAPAAAAPAAGGAQADPAGGGGAAKADWYPDPRGEKRLRYWDGSQWTDHTSA